jgi:hypothetical protein
MIVGKRASSEAPRSLVDQLVRQAPATPKKRVNRLRKASALPVSHSHTNMTFHPPRRSFEMLSRSRSTLRCSLGFQ